MVTSFHSPNQQLPYVQHIPQESVALLFALCMLLSAGFPSILHTMAEGIRGKQGLTADQAAKDLAHWPGSQGDPLGLISSHKKPHHTVDWVATWFGYTMLVPNPPFTFTMAICLADIVSKLLETSLEVLRLVLKTKEDVLWVLLYCNFWLCWCRPSEF